MVYLKTYGGLANRLRVCASAYKFAQEANIGITIIWDLDSGLNCDFNTLFTLNTDCIHVKNRRITVANQIPIRIIDRLIFHELEITGNQFEIITNRYVSTCHNFYDAHDYSFLKFNDDVVLRAKMLLDGHGFNNFIGIQIRRGDNTQSIRNSPTGLFVEKMEEELNIHPDTVFFLATDDIQTKNELINRFGERIIYNNSVVLRRDTKEGIIDAAIDLYALSCCNKIYGSFYSSFCEVASDIGRNELIIVK